MVLTWVEILLLVLICCSFSYSTWNSMYRNRNLPPGPPPLPFIGNLLQIERGQMVNSLMKLWKRYGPVYTLYFGSRPVIVVCGYEAVKEALVDHGDEFGGRGRVATLDKFAGGYGLGFSNGERWRQMKIFTLKTMKNFGMGKKSIEEKIQEEAHFLVKEFTESKEMPIDPSKKLGNAIANILCSIIFGNRFEYTDERFAHLLGIVDRIFSILSSSYGQLQNLFPKLMDYVPGPHQMMCSISEELNSFIYDSLKRNREHLDPNCPRDFIDCCLIKLEEEKDNPDTEFTMKNILLTIYSLFVGGIDTSTTVLKHSFLILVKHPEIQAKIHQEIDEIIGRERTPNFSDLSQMPYTDAVISEILRFCDLVPMNLPHMVTKDTHFRGFTIPKGTKVYPILCSVHRDPTQFSTPYKFNPNHFLDENGRYKKNQALMAFSIGKRSCPGEGLARKELFLFLTTILQNFTVTSQRQFTEADIAPRMEGFLNAPIPYQVSFVPNSQK
ncbi:cytochrome P450 2A6-like [Pelodytes ibericus]